MEFGICHSCKVSNADGEDEIWPVTKFRLYTELVPEWGHIELEPGKYELVFDNSYSWLRAKTINFMFTIE